LATEVVRAVNKSLVCKDLAVFRSNETHRYARGVSVVFFLWPTSLKQEEQNR